MVDFGAVLRRSPQREIKMTVKASVLILFTLWEIWGELQISQLNKISQLNEINLVDLFHYHWKQDLIDSPVY